MRNVVVILAMLAVSVLIGCLGVSTSGGDGASTPVSPIPTDAALVGRVFFSSRSLYGGISIQARNVNDQIIAETTTDDHGYFYFSDIKPGVYNFFTDIGGTEVQFQTGVQVISDVPLRLPERSLLELQTVRVDRITSSSVRLRVRTSDETKIYVEESEHSTSMRARYSYAGTNYSRNHEVTITGLQANRRYSFPLKQTSRDGQVLVHSSVYTSTTPPAGPSNLGVIINNGETISRFRNLRLELSADNARQMRVGESETLDSAPWENFSNTREFTFSSGDGLKRVYVQFRDDFNNESSVINSAVLLHAESSGYVGVFINDGEGLTNDPVAVLTMLFPGAIDMQISTKPDFFNAFWEPFANTREIKFSDEDGEKNVYTRFRGGMADPNKIFSATIMLDTTGPEVSMQINDGAAKTNDVNVTLSFEPLKLPREMQIRNSGDFTTDPTWIKFANPYKYIIPREDGEKLLYARFRDALGNVYGPIVGYIELDTIPPSDVSLIINGGATQTADLVVTLSLSAIEADWVYISNNEDYDGAVRERYNTIKKWELGGYGLQTVYVTFYDDASNSTEIFSTIEMLGEELGSSSVTINDGDISADTNVVSVRVQGEEVEKFRIAQNKNFSSAPEFDYNPSEGGAVELSGYVLDPTAGQKWVYVRFEDASGSFSFASDYINLVGPASNTISMIDELPLTSYKINLRPFSEGASQMLITEDYGAFSNESSWVDFSFLHEFELLQHKGKHTIYAKFRNEGGVETKIMSLDVIVGDLPAILPYIMVNSGDAMTDSSAVTIKVVKPEQYENVRLSNDQQFSNVADLVQDEIPWTIKPAAGEQTVYARFEHSTTGEFYFTNDSIQARGPENPSVSTKDTQPMNKNIVELVLNAEGATDMLISKYRNFPAPDDQWKSYNTYYNFSLGDKTGPHTVYAKFRNSSENWIESEVVSLPVSINDSVPSGSPVIRLTALAESAEVKEIPVASLPVYLHFENVAPNTATISYQVAPAGSPLPDSWRVAASPFLIPVKLDASDFPGNGDFFLFYKFADGVGNMSPVRVITITVLGPKIVITPSVAGPLSSGQIQQFAARLENSQGTVVWSVSPSDPPRHGTINSSGLFTAPNPITTETTTTVIAQLFGDPTVKDEAVVSLKPQVEVVITSLSHQVSVGATREVQVRFRNSSQGGSVNIDAGGGTAMISAAVAGDPATDMIATVTFTAPLLVPADNPVLVKVASIQDPTRTQTISFNINSGPWVSISPASANSRIRTGVTLFSATCSSPTATIHWTLPVGAYFDSGKTLVTATASSTHTVYVYAPDIMPPTNPINLIASFTEGGTDYTDSVQIILDPAVSLSITPKFEVIDLGNTSGITFQANVEHADNTAVSWQYKNSNDSTWVGVDMPANNNGRLVSSGNDAVYYPPAQFPTPPSVLTINVRSTSVEDSVASGVATITLIAPIAVTIHDGFDGDAPDITYSLDDTPPASISVTLEVGTRQLFAKINNATSGTDLTATWLVENIVQGNDTVGTIDSTGKYTAPDTLPKSVTLTAKSNANTSKSASAIINLQNFWQSSSEGLQIDTENNASISSMKADWTTPGADPKVIYAGTGGFGVYRAEITDWNSVAWVGTDLSVSVAAQQGGKYAVNDISISVQNSDRVVAATNDGLYLITNSGLVSSQIIVPHPRVVAGGNYSEVFTSTFASAVIDPGNDDYMYAVGESQGVLRFKWDGTTYVYDGTLYDDRQLYSVVKYYEYSWNVNTGTVATPTMQTGTAQRPSRHQQLASATMEFHCITIDTNNSNVLYVGFSNYLNSRSPDTFQTGYIKLTNARTSEYLVIGSAAYYATGIPPVPHFDIADNMVTVWPPGGNPEVLSNWYYVGGSGQRVFDTAGGIILDMAVDPNTSTTLWKAKDQGIHRSTDGGATFRQVGNFSNIKSIFIDPINTVNIYLATEYGVYRTIEGYSPSPAWKRIHSGLKDHTTINSIILTPGGLGNRRLLIGTTNGAFVGRTDLNLD